MKKILNVVFAFATLLAVTGCSNAISLHNSTEFDKDYSAKAQVQEAIADSKDVTKKFYVNEESASITVDNNSTFSSTKKTESKISIPFSLNVDAESAKTAFKIYSIDCSDREAKVYKQKSVVTIKDIEVYKTNVNLFVDLKDIDAIEIDIDPTVLKATNGQKLDLDGDFAQGEATDDAYFAYIESYSSSLPRGPVAKDPRGTFSITNSGFLFSSKTWIGTVTGLASEENLEEVLGNNVKIQYCTAGGTWTDVNTSASSSGFEYKLTWTEDIKNAMFRVIANKPNEIVSKNEYAGFKKRLSLDARTNVLVIASGIPYVPALENQASSQDFFSGITFIKNSAKAITAIEFVVNKEYTEGLYPVCGISDLKDALHAFDSSITEFSLPEFETLYSKEEGASFNNIITIIFNTPVYNLSSLYLDPEFAVKIDENGTVKEYVIGYDASTILSKTKGYVSAVGVSNVVPAFIRFISEYSNGKLVNVSSDSGTNVKFTIPEGYSVKISIGDGYSGSAHYDESLLDGKFDLYAADTSRYVNSDSPADTTVSATYSDVDVILTCKPYNSGRTGNVWVKIEII